MNLSGSFTGAMHVYPLRVYFEDTDAGGVVYHATYLNFAERARTEMMRLLGCEHPRMIEGDGIVFAVRRASADYRRPARLDDLLEVHTRVVRLGGASIDVEQAILRPADGEVLCVVELRLVCMSVDEHRAVRIPEDLRRRVVALDDETREQGRK